MRRLRVNRHLIFIVVAVVIGLVASLAAVHYIHRAALSAEQAHTAPAQQTERVAVPVADLKQGDVLAAGDLAARNVPVDFVPDHAVTPANYRQYVGAVLTMPLRHGVPVPARALEPLTSHFSNVINEGDVAVTMQVDDVNSISGLISPGDHVDVLWTPSGRSRNPQTRPLLSNVLVLATGQNVRGAQARSRNHGARNYSDITMELSPKNAQRLSVARKAGSLSVWLRRAGSSQPLNLGIMTKATLLRGKRRHRRRGIQFIIGGKG